MDQQLVYALLAVGIMLAIGFPVHEFSHAMAAYRLGDSTARWQGRLSLDPRVHFDPTGGMLLVISAVISGGSFFFGYAKPTPVNPMNLRWGRHGEAVVAAAGPISNLVMAALVALPLRLILDSPDLYAKVASSSVLFGLVQVAFAFLQINVFLCIFNLLPVPPLDGWHVLMGLVPPRTAWTLRSFERQYAAFIPIVFLLFFILAAPKIIVPIADTLINILLGTG